jgi:hypothetical protein
VCNQARCFKKQGICGRILFFENIYILAKWQNVFDKIIAPRALTGVKLGRLIKGDICVRVAFYGG